MTEEVVFSFRTGFQMPEFDLVSLLADAIERCPISAFTIGSQDIDIVVKRDCFPDKLMAEL